MRLSWRFGTISRRGAVQTLVLTAGSVFFGLLIGLFGAVTRDSRSKVVARVVAVYVEIVRNTPMLVQMLIFFFALPMVGIQISATAAALMSISFNLGAYATEIIRAGILAIPKTQIEAGLALGHDQAERHAPHCYRSRVARYFSCVNRAADTDSPGNESRFCDLRAEELTSAASFVESTTFRSLETYLVLALVYICLTFFFRLIYRLIALVLFRRKMPPKIEELSVSTYGGSTVMLQTFGWDIFLFLLRGAGWTLMLFAFLHRFRLPPCASVVASEGFWRRSRSRLLSSHTLSSFRRPRFSSSYSSFSLASAFWGCIFRPLLAAGVALSLYTAAYCADIWRGCIEAIPRPQWEGGQSLALSLLQQLRYIILPQAFKIALGPTVGFMVQLLKNSSLTALIGFVELTPRRTDRQQYDVPAVQGVSDRRRDLLRHVLSTVAAQPEIEWRRECQSFKLKT